MADHFEGNAIGGDGGSDPGALAFSALITPAHAAATAAASLSQSDHRIQKECVFSSQSPPPRSSAAVYCNTHGDQRAGGGGGGRVRTAPQKTSIW